MASRPIVYLLMLVAVTLGAPGTLAQEAGNWFPKSLSDASPLDQWPLRFDAISHDCGQVLAGNDLSARFSFVNVSSEPISPRNWGGCGLWSMRWDKRQYLPGERGEVEVVCGSRNLLREGRHTRVVPVVVANGHEAKMALEVNVDWVPEIVQRPREFHFPLCRQGQLCSHRIVIAGRSPGFEVLAAHTEYGVLRARLIGETVPLEIAGQPYRAYEVDVELPADADVGVVYDRLLVETNDPRWPTCWVSGVGLVVGEVFAVGRGGLSCIVRGEEEVTASLDLQSWTGQPFRVLGIETVADARYSMEDVELEVTATTPAAETGGLATLTLRAKLLNPERRSWVGRARVETDLAGEKPLLVLIYLRRAPQEPAAQ